VWLVVAFMVLFVPASGTSFPLLLSLLVVSSNQMLGELFAAGLPSFEASITCWALDGGRRGPRCAVKGAAIYLKGDRCFQ